MILFQFLSASLLNAHYTRFCPINTFVFLVLLTSTDRASFVLSELLSLRNGSLLPMLLWDVLQGKPMRVERGNTHRHQQEEGWEEEEKESKVQEEGGYKKSSGCPKTHTDMFFLVIHREKNKWSVVRKHRWLWNNDRCFVWCCFCLHRSPKNCWFFA